VAIRVRVFPLERRASARAAWPALLVSTLVAGPLLAAPVAGAASVAAAPAEGRPADDEERTVAMLAEASRSVVCIRTLRRHADPARAELHEMSEGGGSGFIWDRQGHLVTNYHVLEGADGAEVIFSDGSLERARLVGGDAATDLAVLRVDGPSDGLRPLPTAPSAALRVGQRVFAVGNPFGLVHTVTHGIVSALGRQLDAPSGATLLDVVQTDAAINPGNSGGPLLDRQGRLVGVSTALVGASGDSAGLGFAIAAATVERIVPLLIRDGRVRRADLGVVFAPDGLTRALGLRGALVFAVSPDSEAERLGLVGTARAADGRWQPGDLVEALDGATMRSAGEALRALEGRRPGDTVEIEIYRGGVRRTVLIRLAEAAASPPLRVPSEPQ